MRKALISTLIVSNILMLCYLGFKELNAGKDKIAYVRSHDLVYQYAGMLEAQQLFETRKVQLNANLDTLRMDYKSSLEIFQQKAHQLSSLEKEKHMALLEQQQQNLLKYAENVKGLLEEEEEQILQGVLNQVNAHAHAFAENEGYELVLGTTLSGSILYGEPAIDITEDLLALMNTTYKGES